MSLDHPLEEPTAIRTNLGAIFVSLELSRSTWLITSLSPGGGEKMSKHSVSAGDIAALLSRFSELKQKAFARTGRILPNHRHSRGGTGWLLDSSGAAERRHRELRRRSGLDCDVAPSAAGQDRQDRRRGFGSRATGVQTRRTACLRHGQGADA